MKFLLVEREELTFPGYKQRPLLLKTQSRSRHLLVGGGAVVGKCLVRVGAIVTKYEPFYTSMDLCKKYESHPFFCTCGGFVRKVLQQSLGRQSMNASLSSLAC